MKKYVRNLIIDRLITMMLRLPGVLLISLLLTGILTTCGTKEPDNTFYIQNTLDGFKNAPHTAKEKAELTVKIGFDGLEGFGYKDFFELKAALNSAGLSMPVNYVALIFGDEGNNKDSSLTEIKEMISASDKGSIIYFHLHSSKYMNDRIAGDTVVSGILRNLSDYATTYGVKLCVYPHVSTYCETVAHSVKIAKIVDRENYGAVINLCHLLKVEGSENIDATVNESSPFLFAVNICGADDGDTRNMGWERLIQPLGQGSFDTYHFMKLLWDDGYKGPVGLQCYNLKGEAEEILKQSFETWEKYKKRYSEGQ